MHLHMAVYNFKLQHMLLSHAFPAQQQQNRRLIIATLSHA